MKVNKFLAVINEQQLKKHLKEFRLVWKSNADLCNDTMQCSIH